MRKAAGLAVSLCLVGVLVASSSHAGPSFDTPVKIAGSTDLFEPGIDVAPDGSIYVNAPPGLPIHGRVWRSTDGGASFDNMPFSAPLSRFPGGGDTDVAITPTGRLYFIDLWAGSNSVARSDDGSTWSIGTPFSTLPLSDRQWITYGGPSTVPGEDTVFVVYSTFEANVFVARSETSGLTWETETPIFGSGGFTGPIVSDQNGFVAFDAVDGPWISVWYSTQNGDLNSFRSASIAEGAWDRSIPSLAMADGMLYATWIDGETFQVKEAHASVADPETWSVPVTLSSGGSNVYSWIDARGSKVAVAWYGTDDGSGSPADNHGPWYLNYSESLDAGATYSPAIKAAANVLRNTPVCTDGVGCPNLGHDGREFGDFLQVAIDLEGKSLISYVDPNAGNVIKIVKQSE